MSPSIKVTGNTSGAALWNAHEHKVADLVGLRVDNRSAQDVKVDFLDAFTTDASKTNAAGATQAAEDLGSTTVASGRIRLQLTVPTLESISLGKPDLEEVTFLGKGYARGDLTSDAVVIVASYKLR